MIAGSHPSSLDEPAAARLAELERRLARVEALLGVEETPELPPTPSAGSTAAAAPPARRREDELEFELGQNWFARVGILALAAGAGFLLSLPHSAVPPAVPSFVGLAVAAVLFGLTRLSAGSFQLVSRYLRGAGLLLLYFSVLRLFYFGERPALHIETGLGCSLLVAAVAFNLVVALRRHSPWLLGLALLTGYATALVVPGGWFGPLALVALAAIAAVTGLKNRWPAITLGGTAVTLASYVGWAALNAPVSGVRLAVEPAFAPVVPLVAMLIFAVAPLTRAGEGCDVITASVLALLNCALGYGAFLLHTYATFGPAFVPAHGAAAMLLLGFAVLHWTRHGSEVATFSYAMTGYIALSVAIIKVAPAPDVFVWLSLQSLLVVATAIWFGSRFIVVANFIIYVGIVLAYMLVKERETGISIGFGIVALVSARLLNWQKHRLELKTDLMRNAYLASAFVVFPYALNHLVIPRHVALAWVALALGYYLLSVLFQNRKYRWMGHGTLVLTTLYLAIVGSRQFEPAYRVASFLALGTVLLIVSLLFTRQRQRGRPAEHR